MMVSFDASLQAHGLKLRRESPTTLQVNVGKLCNLACSHCHVNAGPGRKEIITRDTIDRIIDWLDTTDIPIVDLTGGAPEMIPDFRYFVTRLQELEVPRHIIDRCNLTILLDPAHDGLAEFLRDHRVEIIASMPCYTPENVNAQRGDGVFDDSIKALQLLNQIGYGRNPKLPLHLVYNPLGANLPGHQADLETDYKRELLNHFGIEFNSLYALANLPIARFASYLRHNGLYDDYMTLLATAFNPATVPGLMCRHTISVSWQGQVHDCDFNQMLNLPMGGRDQPTQFLWQLDPTTLADNPIATAPHCLGCTAGCGSSCGGAIQS